MGGMKGPEMNIVPNSERWSAFIWGHKALAATTSSHILQKCQESTINKVKEIKFIKWERSARSLFTTYKKCKRRWKINCYNY
jgi:hypothetical protein